MLTYEELMRRRRLGRAKAMRVYARYHGIYNEEAKRIIQDYLDEKITYEQALNKLYALARRKKRSKKQRKRIKKTR